MLADGSLQPFDHLLERGDLALEPRDAHGQLVVAGGRRLDAGVADECDADFIGLAPFDLAAQRLALDRNMQLDRIDRRDRCGEGEPRAGVRHIAHQAADGGRAVAEIDQPAQKAFLPGCLPSFRHRVLSTIRRKKDSPALVPEYR